jgi:hypothetical protein
MSELLAKRAEITKLARLLGCDEWDLAYLERTDATTLRELRDSATDVLTVDQHPSLRRLARLGRLLPVGMAARIAERSFDPLICARLVPHLDNRRAAALARQLSPRFLAALSVELDPRRAAAIIDRLPHDVVAAVAEALVARGEIVAMGRFVGCLELDAVVAALSVVDAANLARIALVVEDRTSIAEVARRLSDETLSGILAAALDEELWPEILGLIDGLDDARLRDLAESAAVDGLLQLAGR